MFCLPLFNLREYYLRDLQLFYSSLDFVWDNPRELIQKETFTHSHLSWSSNLLHMLPPPIPIYGILPVQSACLRVFLHNLCPCFLWFTSLPDTLHFIIHAFIHQTIVFFSQHMPIPLQPVLL